LTREDEATALETWDANVRLTPWALQPVLVGVLGAAAAIRKLPHTTLTFVS